MDLDPDQHGAPFSVGVDERGIVRLTWTHGLHIDEQVAEQSMRVVDDTNGPLRRPLIVDTTGPAIVTRGARSVFTRPSSVSRVALLGRTPVDQVLANFVLRLTSPPIPTRFFTSEDKAVSWLLDSAP